MFRIVKKNGFYNIYDKKNEQFFHSFYNPEREAKIKLKKLDCRSNDFLIVLGNGFGYLMEVAYYDYKVTDFLIIEPIENFINYSLLKPSIRKIINNTLINVFFFTPQNYKKKLLKNLLLLQLDRNIKVIESGYFMKINTGFKKRVFIDIKNTISELKRSVKELNQVREKFIGLDIFKSILLSPTRGEIGL